MYRLNRTIEFTRWGDFQRWIKNNFLGSRRLPFCLLFEVTNICNLNCSFCAYSKLKRQKGHMPLGVFRKAIDDFGQMGGRYISLTPVVGDPLLDPTLFDKLEVIKANSKILGAYFYTNGVALTPSVSKRLMDFSEKLSIFISWGGFNSESYKRIMGKDFFELVLNNVRAFVGFSAQLKQPFKLTIAIRGPEEERQGSVFQELLSWKKDNLISFESRETFDDWSSSIPQTNILNAGLNLIDKSKKKGVCQYLLMKPMVLLNGKVSACGARDMEGQLIIGDLNKDSFQDIWNGKKLKTLLSEQQSNIYREPCRNCSFYTSVKSPNNRLNERGLNWSK